MNRLVFSSLMCVLLPACSSHGDTTTQPFTGVEGKPVAGTIVSHLIAIPMSFDGKAAPPVIVDTGAPVVLFDASVVPPGTAEGDASLTAGALSFSSVPYVTGFVPQPVGQALGGFVGCTLICSFRVAFDYRRAAITFGDAALPPDVGPPSATLSFTLERGGTATTLDGSQVELPKSRILLTASVEGEDHMIMLDTGASEVSLSASLFKRVSSDGRRIFTGFSTTTLSGSSTGSVARLRSLRLGGAEYDGAAAASDESIDQLLETFGKEVGHPVDALVGATFLQNFYVVIDYPEGKLELHPYTSKSSPPDEFTRVGVAVNEKTPGPKGAGVAKVYPGTDADAQGLRAGDSIVSIDGTLLTGLKPEQVDALLEGSAGESRALVVTTEGGTSKTLDVRVDDLIALE